MNHKGYYKTLAEIESVVSKFENCSFLKEEFTHARHLTVAAYYLSQFSPAESLERMREALLRFTRHHGVTGYHETITRFWLLLTEDFLRQSRGECFVNQVNALIDSYGRKDVLFEYYSRELVTSVEARNKWIEPDLKPIGLEKDRSGEPKKQA